MDMVDTMDIHKYNLTFDINTQKKIIGTRFLLFCRLFNKAMDFGELENDKAFVDKVEKLSASIDIVSEQIKSACDFPNYEELATEDKVKFDLYLSYSINSLFWMLCKLQAIDTNEVSSQTLHKLIVVTKIIFVR